MNKYRLYRIFLNFSLAFLMIGFLFRIMHWQGGSAFISIAYVLSIVYVVIGVVETFQDEQKEMLEKGAWLIGFLFLTPITGIVYYFTEIKKKSASA